MKNFDPEMNALEKRKGLAVKILLEPQAEEAMEEPKEEALEVAEEGGEEAELAGETAEVEQALLGKDDAQSVVDMYIDRKPQSLGEKMKLQMAKLALSKKA